MFAGGKVIHRITALIQPRSRGLPSITSPAVYGWISSAENCREPASAGLFVVRSSVDCKHAEARYRDSRTSAQSAGLETGQA
jgi:hypothetical protein